LIVFFPLYPILASCSTSSFTVSCSGLFVSNVCWVLAAYMLYELALLIRRAGALRALKYLCILPASFSLLRAFGQSVFAAFAPLVYCVRKDLYPFAASRGSSRRLRGCRASAIRPRLLRAGRADRARTPRAQQGRRWRRRAVTDALSLLLIPCGLLLYLYVNRFVTGNA
jgi:hypothetical protein